MDLPEFLKAVGENVRRARWARGLTQEQLAATTINLRSLREIERGVRNPSLGTVLLLADALGTTPGQLVDTDEKATATAKLRIAGAAAQAPKRGRKARPKRTARS